MVSRSLSLSPFVVKGGLKLADCAKKAEALWTKDKEKTISTIKDFAIRKAEDIVEQLPATAWERYCGKLQGVSHQIKNLGPPIHPVREMGGCGVLSLSLSKVWLGW